MGGSGDRNTRQVVEAICTLMDQFCHQGAPHASLITLVNDRPDHDRHYAIDPTLIRSELGWQPYVGTRPEIRRRVIHEQRWLVSSSPTGQQLSKKAVEEHCATGKKAAHPSGLKRKAPPTTGNFMRIVHNPYKGQTVTRP